MNLAESDHLRYDSGQLRATPGCGCDYCEAVFEDWSNAAEGFQRWYACLTPAPALHYFGEFRHAC